MLSCCRRWGFLQWWSRLVSLWHLVKQSCVLCRNTLGEDHIQTLAGLVRDLDREISRSGHGERGQSLQCSCSQFEIKCAIIIIMEICKAPTLRLKALNKHSITHTMYIEMELLSAIKVYKKKKKLTHNVDRGSSVTGQKMHTHTMMCDDFRQSVWWHLCWLMYTLMISYKV